VLEPGRYRARVLGEERELCCAGCEAVARTIVAAGFERYYETRAAAGARPAHLPPLDIYDDPLAQKEFVAAPAENEREVSLILDRVRCAACLWLNEQALRRLPGVTRAEVNYTTQRAHVAWDPRRLKLSQILAAVRTVGYDAYPYAPGREEELARRERRGALWRLFVAGFGAMQAMMYAFPAYLDGAAGTLAPDAAGLMRWAGLAITLPVVAFSCRPFFDGAWRELKSGRIGLDTPIALGIGGGFAASAWATVGGGGEVYYDSICMLAFLLLGARTLEAAARRRAARGLDPLLRWMPAFAQRIEGASPVRVPAHALAAGDRVLVPAGDRIPADGVLEAGASSADESLLTGEARPVPKREGAALIGGSVNLEQPLTMRVTRAGADTQAAAIARLAERAAAGKPRLIESADRVARALTWLVIVVAAAAYLYSRDVWIAVAVLVVTCPCALALAAPVALTRANAALAARGALLTRGRALEALERATDVVLDKTGTLTTGRLAIAGVATLRPAAGSWLGVAKALEAGSRHPIARAFDSQAAPAPAEQVREFPGEGVEGMVQSRRVRIGSERFCRALCGGEPPRRLAAGDALRTPVFMADGEGWLCAVALEDELRADSLALVAALKERGLRVHLASGDAAAPVAALARRLGIETFAGAMTPRDKLEYLERLQREGKVVAMIGDGLNDAPVLARADVSFALGEGAPAAQLQADVVLTGSRLGAVREAFAAARGAMRVVRQNFGWALAYNALALPLAAAGWIGPWEAALGMSASSFVVLANSLRPLPSLESWKASTSSSPSRSLSYS
jgi:Cu2+-exporting ATPase